MLVAAHSVEGLAPPDIQVQAGLSPSKVISIVRHPDYKPINRQNDIAIITLEKPLTLDGKKLRAVPVRIKEPMAGDLATGYGKRQLVVSNVHYLH